jgi:hypothetical protein
MRVLHQSFKRSTQVKQKLDNPIYNWRRNVLLLPLLVKRVVKYENVQTKYLSMPLSLQQISVDMWSVVQTIYLR